MSDTPATKPSLSGGEIPPPLREAYQRLRALISKEDDVHCIHDLAQRVDGTFLYFIETPFDTHPRFVIGETDADNSAVVILFKCGTEWSAQAAWDRLRHPKLSTPSES